MSSVSRKVRAVRNDRRHVATWTRSSTPKLLRSAFPKASTASPSGPTKPSETAPDAAKDRSASTYNGAVSSVTPPSTPASVASMARALDAFAAFVRALLFRMAHTRFTVAAASTVCSVFLNETDFFFFFGFVGTVSL